MAAAFSSCSKYDDSGLRDSIKDLNEQVTGLEAAIEEAQSVIAELHELFTKLSEGLTVSSVEETDDGYIIIFSDGTEVSLRNGSPGDDYNTPRIIPVEEDGVWYWGWSDNSTPITVNGEKIPVTSTMPLLRINNGYWEVSLDGGLNWIETDNMPGTPSDGQDGNTFFTGLSEDDDNYYLELEDGGTITLPKTKELSLVFNNAEDTVYFSAGATRDITYTMTGTASMTVSKPEGWSVTVNEEASSLSVTAPVEDNVYAETAGTVSVILTDNGGHSAAASFNVAIGAGSTKETPAIGSYYYSDGTWSAALDENKTVIGIVFWAGDPTAYDPGLKADHPDCVNGLAVALNGSATVKYQQNAFLFNLYLGYGTVSDWLAENTDCTPLLVDINDETQRNSRLGYSQTLSMEVFNSSVNVSYALGVMEYVEQYRMDVPAPESSSDWYMPSLKELTLLFGGDVDPNEPLKTGSVKAPVNSSIRNIPGATELRSTHLSSCEKDTNNSFAINMDYGDVENANKETGKNARLIIAF